MPLMDLANGPASTRYLVGFDLRRRPHLDADVLIVGGGVAGLSAALAAAAQGREVLLLSKGAINESNTFYAQGGIAAVLGSREREAADTLDLHIQDTLIAGGGLCDPVAVKDILGSAEAAIDGLRAVGCDFDRGDGGGIDLTREGGHSARRILHAHGDSTGQEVIRSLVATCMAHAKITIIENAFALDLISDGARVAGVLYSRRNELFAALAGATLLATGGCGRIWRETTNPAVATGDGLAIAYRAGAELADLEFMQFHPTTLYIAGGARLLITEAMRGEGAVLKNQQGYRFMPNYHPDADLAPRDVVTRAIIDQIRKGEFPHVWLDATHLGRGFLTDRFPAITQACAKLGIDIANEWMPVHPSAHYHCGGVRSDHRGRTSLDGLWVAGEVGCTGLHGANRLASNSILEGLVLGLRAGQDCSSVARFPGRVRLEAPRIEQVSAELDSADLVRSLRAMMWRQVGIERTGSDLALARRSLAFWSAHQARGECRDRVGWQLQNMLLVGQLIAQAAEWRRASVGTHCRTDSFGPIETRHLVVRREGTT